MSLRQIASVAKTRSMVLSNLPRPVLGNAQETPLNTVEQGLPSYRFTPVQDRLLVPWQLETTLV